MGSKGFYVRVGHKRERVTGDSYREDSCQVE